MKLRRAAAAFAVLLALLPALHGCSPSLEKRLQEARNLADEGRFEELLPEMTELHYAAPQDPEVNHLYGLTLLRTRNGGMAIWPLLMASKTPGREVEDGMLLAQALAAGSVPEDAIGAVDRVLEFDPELIDAWVLRSNVNRSMKKFEEMLADCEAIVAIDETRHDAILCQVDALSSLERFEEAEALLAESRTKIESRAALPPRLDWRFCTASAGLAQSAGDDEKAATRWESCLAKSPTALELIEPAIQFFDGTGNEERSTEILEEAVAESPHRFELISALAQRLMSLGRDEESEALLKEATTRKGTARGAWVALADYYRQRDDFDRAVEAMDKVLVEKESLPVLLIAQYADDLIQAHDFDRADAVIAQLPDHPMVALLRGRMHLEKGDAAAALEELDKGMELWPSNSTARYLAGQASEEIGDIDRALEEYRNAMRSDQAHTPAALELARLHEAEGNLTAALIALRHRMGAVPDDADAHLATLRIAKKTGRFDFAREILEGMSQIPGQEETVAIELAALAAIEEGPDAAVQVLSESELDLSDPEKTDVLAALAHYLVVGGNETDALARVNDVLEAHPDSAGLHEVHGSVLLVTSSTDADAKAAFERSLELDPERTSVLARLAHLAVAEGDKAEAVALLDRASAMDPEESAFAWQAIQVLVDSRKSAVMLDTAVEAQIDERVDALLDQEATHAGAAQLRAERLIAESVKGAGGDRDRSLEEAAEYAQRAIRFGGGPSAVIVRARVATAAGQPGAAVEMLQRLESLEPRSPVVWYELGLAFEEAGAPERARAALERALDGEDFDEASEARQALGRLEVGADA